MSYLPAFGLFTQTRNTLCAGAGKQSRQRRRLIWKFVSEVTLKLCFSHKLRCKHAPRVDGAVRARLKESFRKKLRSRFGRRAVGVKITHHINVNPNGTRRGKITKNINIELIDKVASLNIHTSWKSHCCLVEGSLFCGKQSCNTWNPFASSTHTRPDIETLFTDNHHNYVSLSWKELREGSNFVWCAQCFMRPTIGKSIITKSFSACHSPPETPQGTIINLHRNFN